MEIMEYEYKVIDVADGAISSLLLGEGRIETGVLEAYTNAMASEGWRLVFMVKVMQRHLVVANRETLMITFERRVPEAERESRAARCIDDVIAAEEKAKKKGHAAAAGAVGMVAASAVLGSLAQNAMAHGFSSAVSSVEETSSDEDLSSGESSNSDEEASSDDDSSSSDSGDSSFFSDDE